MAEKLNHEVLPDGVVRETFEEDGALITRRTFDHEPLAKVLAAEREANQGTRYGDMKKLGTIPPHVYAVMLRDGRANDPIALAKWLDENPMFKSIDKKFVL